MHLSNGRHLRTAAAVEAGQGNYC